MRTSIIALLVSTLILSACGAIRDSRVNPFNWFGGARSEPVEAGDPQSTNPLIPTRGGLFGPRPVREEAYEGKPIERVSSLIVERVPGGAIVRATGVARLQGVYAAQLTPTTEDETPVDGVLTYRLEALKPDTVQVQGTVATREVTVGRALTAQQLAGVRTIRVEGATNAMVTRR